MKKILSLFFALFVFSLAGHSQLPGTWTPKGSGITATNRSFQGISVVDSLTVWGITYNTVDGSYTSEFTRTTNGGQSWTSGLVGGGPAFFMANIFALNKDTAWVVGYTENNANGSHIRKTTDGGATWTAQSGSFTNQAGVYMVYIHFFDANEGVAYGGTLSKLKIWTTANGGSTWTEIPENTLPFLPSPNSNGESVGIHYGNGHYAVAGDTLWVGGNSFLRIWRSVDRGKTWKAFDWSSRNVGGAIWSVSFKDSRNGIAVSSSAGLQTFDGGETWHPLTGLPATLTYYQIEHIPGTNGAYYLTYEGSNQYYSDFRHAYSLDDGKTWVYIGKQPVECLEFLSPTKAWGGGKVTNATTGGMYVWSGEFPAYQTPDYAAVGRSEKLSPYTMATQRQARPLEWKHRLTNTGKLPLTNITADLVVRHLGNEEKFQQPIAALAPGETKELSFGYTPQKMGIYTFSLSASQAQLGNAFYKSPDQTFEITNSAMAKDDGTTETQLGFGFGNPSWYGYYGSAFDLPAQDTITAITVQINRNSNFFNGSIHLLVNQFDSLGIPSIELFHSSRIVLSDHGLSSSKNRLTYTLSTPLVVPAGKYLLAAGQDTLTGVIGFDFDLNNVSGEGFWLVGPLATSRNWRNPIRREAMIIRPHFKTDTEVTTSREIQNLAARVKLYPNPFATDMLLEFELDNPGIPVQAEVHDLLGRCLYSQVIQRPNAGLNQLSVQLAHAPSGILLVSLRQGDRVKVKKVVKE